MSAKTNQTEALIDQRLVKALGHPMRQRILHQLGDDEHSPNQIAAALGEPLGNVSYHVKILADCGAVELVRTAPVRGATEHFYRARALPRLNEAEWQRLHPATRRALFDATLSQIWDDVVAASRSGGFENTKSHISWTRLELDEKGYARLLEEIEKFIDRALALQAQSENRLSKLAPEDQVRHSTEAVLMHFHRALDQEPDGRRRRRPKKG